MLFSIISCLIAAGGPLFICLPVFEVSGLILKLQCPLFLLFELHTMHLRIELKHFGHLYLVILICNFLGIVTVYN